MSLSADLRPWFQRAVGLYQTWFEGKSNPEGAETPGTLLRLLNSLGGRILQAMFFIYAAFRQPALAGILVLLIAVVFFLSRHSAEIELDIGAKAFPVGREPEQWSGKRDAATITVSVFAFFALYIALALTAGNIRVVSFILLAIACIDFNTRRLIGAKIGAYFRDKRYALRPDDMDRSLIDARRAEIMRFLYDRPHLWKEGARIGGCAVAFGVAVGGHWFGKEWAAPAAYLCLITTLLINEVVTWQWRTDRDRRLKSLEGCLPQVLIPFSPWAWVVSVVFVAVSALVSWTEGTLTSPAVTIGFANHGGMWSDLIVLPLVNGIIMPRLPRITARRAALLSGLFVFALILTTVVHEQWALTGRTLGITDHVFPTHGTGSWYHDLSVAGYLHFVYMSLEITLLFAYACVGMPRSTVVLVTSLLTIHVIVGQAQPAWFATGVFMTTRTIIPTVGAVLVVWLVALFKSHQSAGVEMNAQSVAGTGVG